MDFSQWTVRRMKEELRDRGLRVSGRRDSLLQRLLENEQEVQRALLDSEVELDQAQAAPLEVIDESPEALEEPQDEDGGDASPPEHESESESAQEEFVMADVNGSGKAAATVATSPSLSSWIFSLNAAVALACLLLEYYNSVPADRGSIIERPGVFTLGPFGSFVFHKFFDTASPLAWTMAVACFVVVFTHSEPEECVRLSKGDQVRVRSYLLNAAFFYAVFAGKTFKAIESAGQADEVFLNALTSMVVSSTPLSASQLQTVLFILSECHQVLGLFLYYAVYRGLPGYKKGEEIFNTFAICGASLYFVSSYECVRADNCSEPFAPALGRSLGLDVTYFDAIASAVTASWFALSVYGIATC